MIFQKNYDFPKKSGDLTKKNYKSLRFFETFYFLTEFS